MIRKVLFDAFGTVFSPRIPVPAQYVLVARSLGLQVDEKRVKAGLSAAFKHWNTLHPLYGKLSNPPLDSTLWWSSVITDTFLHAGVPSSLLLPVAPRLSDILVHRFWSREAYYLHPDVLPCLRELHALSSHDLLPAIVSGSDRGIVDVLKDLEVVGEVGGIREEDVWTTWNIEAGKETPVFWERVLERLQVRPAEVLVVGDDLASDYEAPRKAGMRSLLLRREGGGPEGVETVRSLGEMVEWVKRENVR